MSPGFNRSGPCLIVLAEWKAPVYERAGIRLITSAVRRNAPACLDSKIHHNNLINNILAKIQANHAGVDDALMLDVDGFVAETNATNVFLVKRGELVTPHADSCLPGITRGKVIAIAREAAIPTAERNVTLAEVWPPTRCSPPARWASCRRCSRSTAGRSAPAGSARSPAACRTLYAERTATEGTPLPEWD